MRFVYGSAIAVALTLCTSPFLGAQQPDGSVAIKDGGVFAKGWQGKIDAQEEKAGMTLNNARLSEKGNVLTVRTGPATTYWNPANRATGNYTVKATFTESNYMGLNDHPHPYGIVIGGEHLRTPQQRYLYCSPYGNGTVVAGFDKAAVVAPGKLKSTDGIYGIRFAHNTDAVVTGLTVTKN